MTILVEQSVGALLIQERKGRVGSETTGINCVFQTIQVSFNVFTSASPHITS